MIQKSEEYAELGNDCSSIITTTIPHLSRFVRQQGSLCEDSTIPEFPDFITKWFENMLGR